MSKTSYIGVNNVSRKIVAPYVGVDGVAHKATKIYVGDGNGIARLCWSGDSGDVGFNERLIQFINGDLTDLTAEDFGTATTLNCGWACYNYSANSLTDEDLETVPAHTVEMPDTINSLSIFSSFPDPSNTLSGDWGGVTNAVQQLCIYPSLFFAENNVTVKFSKNLLDFSGLYGILFNYEGGNVVDFSNNDAIPILGSKTDSNATCFNGCTIKVPADLLSGWKSAWSGRIDTDTNAPTYVGV